MRLEYLCMHSRKNPMKIPEPRQLPSGSWFIQLRLNGVSIPVTASKKADCRHTAELIKAEYENGKTSYTKKADVTLGEAVDRYIRDRKDSRSPATIYGYQNIRNNYFQSVIDKPIKRIKNWQSLIDQEVNHSPKSIKNAWGLICSVLKDCGLSVPKDIKLPQADNNEHAFFSPDEINTFIAAVKGKSCEIPALLGLHSLRRSEIAGLTWDDIDFDDGTLGMIHVRRTVVPTRVKTDSDKEKMSFIEKDTCKTVDSNREVPIFIPQLREALESVEDKSGKVCKYNPNSLFDMINRICEQNGLPKVGMHGLRHSFASLAYNIGLSEKETMLIGGWSDYRTMIDIYTHIADSQKLRAANKLTAFFQPCANEMLTSQQKT